MPTEEMEISTDLGHNGLVEDIDIDFEFAGQHEDLELGDYNQVEEFQHFNSDNRDELMAEDDDASYGMADADDINYNETAAEVNDYDIVIGDTDVYSWQDDEAADGQEAALNAEQAQDLGSRDAEGIDFVSALITTVKPPHEGQSSALESEVRHAPQKLLTPETENLEPKVTPDLDGIATKDFETVSNAADGANVALNSVTISGNELLPVEIDTLLSDGPHTTEVSNDAVGVLPTATDNQSSSLQINDGNVEDLEEEEDEIGYDQFEEDEGLAEEAAGSTLASNVEPTESYLIEVQETTTETEGLVAAGDADFTADQYQLDEGSFEHVEVQRGQEAHALDHQSASPASSSPGEHAETAEDDSRKRDEADSASVEENVAALARRHVVVVHYGETDYQLFAAKPDDDPSNFFFKDLSALELPLGEFLGGIRNVISEEVSPLDELVLHIDGLGLEFGESMTSQILERYTFGHILSLYDSLVQNDAGEEVVEAPELYMYLMVKPNCLQRLMALQDQAVSGRSLTDVAVYREASPTQEANDTSGGSDPFVGSPDFVEEELYDDEESEEGQVLQEHQNEVEDEAQTVDLEGQLSPHDDGYAEETEETDVFGGDDEEDVVDYDNLDLTTSQQGNFPFSFSSLIPTYCLGVIDCSCDTCWLQRVEEDFAPRPTTVHEQFSSLPLRRSTSSDSASSQRMVGRSGSLGSGTCLKYGSSKTNVLHFQDSANNATNDVSSETIINSISDSGFTNNADSVTTVNDEHEAPPSESTSATVTLDGEPNVEIDYDENDLDISNGPNQIDNVASTPTATLIPSVDEEITWESDNEEARNEQSTKSKPSKQVSTTPGKRTRSNSDAVALAADRKDVKRQRS